MFWRATRYDEMRRALDESVTKPMSYPSISGRDTATLGSQVSTNIRIYAFLLRACVELQIRWV